MLRIIVPFAMLFTCLGCDATRIEKRTESGNLTPSKDEVSANEVTSKWKSFARNEWYELSELRVNDNQSIIQWKIAKPDPQLGIAVAIDLGVLAQPRGFTHFRRLKTNPTETYANLLNNIEINEDQGDELFVVEFYTAEPVDTDQVFDVKSMVQLAIQRDLEDIDRAGWCRLASHPALIDAGKLPVLQSLVEGGVSGRIASLFPAVSPILWNSISTGKRAGKHGILGFTEVDPLTQAIRPVTSNSRKCKAIWNILQEEDKHASVVNRFASHPAESLNGVAVSNLFAENFPAPVDDEWPLAP